MHVRGLSSKAATCNFSGCTKGVDNKAGMDKSEDLILSRMAISDLRTSLDSFARISTIGRAHASLSSLNKTLAMAVRTKDDLVLGKASSLAALVLKRRTSLALRKLATSTIIISVAKAAGCALSLARVPTDLSGVGFLGSNILCSTTVSVSLRTGSTVLFTRIPRPKDATLTLTKLTPLL